MRRQKENTRSKKPLIIIGIICCILFVPIFTINIIIIIKSYVNPDKVPDLFGIKVLIVLSDEMKSKINGGDIVISKTVNPAKLKAGDIITFKEGKEIFTYRIFEVAEENGEPVFLTKGDNSGDDNYNVVTYQQVEGVLWFKVSGFGRFVLFLKSPQGLFIFVGVPLLGLILYDVLRIWIFDKRRKNKESDANQENQKNQEDKEEEENQANHWNIKVQENQKIHDDLSQEEDK